MMERKQLASKVGDGSKPVSPSGTPAPAFAAKPVSRAPASPAPGIGIQNLWPAFRRWWYRVLPFSAVVAAVMGFLGWNLMQQYSASAHLQLDSSGRPLIFQTADEMGVSGGDFRLYKNTQRQMLLLPFVLNAALRSQDLSALPVLANQSDPVHWLQDELEVTFPTDSEIMQVSLKTRDPESCKKIVNAVVDAYMKEVVLNERNTKRQRLDDLERVYSEAETKVRVKRTELKTMASDLGTSDSDSLTVAQQNALQQFGLMQAKLFEIQFQLMQAEGQFKVLKEFEDRSLAQQTEANDNNASTAADYELDMIKTPDLLRLEDDVELMRLRLKNLEEIFVDSSHPSVLRAVRELSTLQELLVKRKEDARESLARQRSLGGGVTGFSGTNGSMLDGANLRARIDVFKNQEAFLQKQVDQLSIETRQLGRTSIDIELMRAEIKGLEGVLLRVGEEIERTNIELKTAPRIRLLNSADMAAPPDLKKRGALTVALGLMGLLIPLGLAMLWDISRQKVDNVELVSQHLALRNLGRIPLISSDPADLDSTKQHRQRSIVRESVHSIAAMLMHRMDLDQSRVFLVTSALPSEGKSTVACQLSSSLASAGKKVILIDFDLRRPNIHRLIGLPRSPGIAEILLGRATWSQAVRYDGSKLFALAAGEQQLSLQRMISNGTVDTLFHELRNNFDVVIVDACPVLPVVDARLISRFTDGVILTLMQGVSRLPAVSQACEQLKSFGAPLIGTVVIGAHGAQYAYYDYQRPQPSNDKSIGYSSTLINLPGGVNDGSPAPSK